MEKVSRLPNNYTSFMRNYFNTSPLYETRYSEWHKGKGEYSLGFYVYPKDGGRKKPLFCIDRTGFNKKLLLEEMCKHLFREFVRYETQGDDIEQVKALEEDVVSDKKENVIIAGAKVNALETVGLEQPNLLHEWSCSQKYYDFVHNQGGLMDRWFAMDSITISTQTPEQSGGLVRSWTIPEDLFKVDFDSINIMPIRGFLKGFYNLEFKMVVQANSFQQCCLMLSTAPYMYGLPPMIGEITGVTIEDGSTRSRPLGVMAGHLCSYADFTTAVQRPHVILDVATGGEVTLQMKQQYHKTLVRNFDFSMVSDVNSGIRGANMGSLMLHVLSKLRYGTGTNNFGVRIFYRFIDAKLTAMVPVVSQKKQNLTHIPGVSADNWKPYLAEHRLVSAMPTTTENDRKAKHKREQELRKYYTQGPVMSILVGTKIATDITTSVVRLFDRAGTTSRRGFPTRNLDKPVDCVSQIRTIQRPRTNFTHGRGIDDAIIMGVSWDELTQFFERSMDEPQSFKDFASKIGFMTAFEWKTTNIIDDSLFEWKINPALLGGIGKKTIQLGTNRLRYPLGIASSCFTNYWGTMELMFQFIKTDSHRGAVEVAIYFGGKVSGTGLRSTYVKVLNIQECSAFKVTVPYIYDTPVRFISGTATPTYMMNLSQPEDYSFYHTARVVVKVLNPLSAVSVVAQEIECLVWVRGGDDFGLNFPHACNTLTVPDVMSFGNLMIRNPSNTRGLMSTSDVQQLYMYNFAGRIEPISKAVRVSEIDNLSMLTQGFETQGDEADFQSGAFCENRQTSANHMDFKDLCKMPVKILTNFTYKTATSHSWAEGSYNMRNYVSIPVCPVNYSLVNFLNSEYYFDISTAVHRVQAGKVFAGNAEIWKSIQCQIASMFSFYRGGVVYTIVVSGSTDPVYYTYLPHDFHLRKLYSSLPTNNWTAGSNGQSTLYKSGNFMPGMNDDDHVDLAMLGQFNGFILPSVNPSERITVPMSTQNNKILLNRQQAQQGSSDKTLRTMRENSEWFNGTLVLWSNSDCKLDVYVNCSDDHEMTGFLGHAGVVNPYAFFALEDNWRTQAYETQGMDFRLKELTQNGWNSFKSTLGRGAISVALGAATLASTKFGTTEVTYFVGGLTAFSVIETSLSATKFATTLTGIENSVERFPQDITDISKNLFHEIVLDAFPYLKNCTKALSEKLWSITSHIVHAGLSGNWKNTSFCLFGVLIELRLFTWDDWSTIRDVMTTWVRSSCVGGFETQADEDGEHWHALLTLLITVFGVKFQVEETKGFVEYFKHLFKYQNYKNITGLNAIISLSRTLFRAVAAIYRKFCETVDPNIRLLQTLREKDGVLYTFVEEANNFLNSFNEKDFRKKELRVRYLHMILRAYKLKVILLRISSPQLTSQLLVLCNGVIAKAQAMRYMMRCDVVIPEPFVVCIEGDSNIGKSFSVYDLSGELLSSTGLKFGNNQLIYTIPAAADYWNGYQDEPVLWFDDWCNLVDEQTMRSHLGQLYGLKTSAPFNVPRAELDNKEQVAAPMLVMMTTNNPFPQSTVMMCKEAVYRRRDCLVRFVMKGNMKDYSEDQLKKFEHITVFYYLDSSKPDSIQGEGIPYSQFVKELKVQFNAFRAKEMIAQEAKLASLEKAIERTPIDEIDIGNPFEAIERHHALNPTELTSQLLESEVEKLLIMINEHCEYEKASTKDDQIFTQGFGDAGKFIVKCCTNLKEKCDKWMQHYRNYTYKCANCGICASVHGTVFKCPEHAHYICVHCAVLGGESFSRRIGNYDGKKFMCPLREFIDESCELVVEQNDIMRAVIAEAIAQKLDGPAAFIHFLRKVFSGGYFDGSMRDTYSIVILLKLYLKTWVAAYRALFKMFCQADEEIDEPHVEMAESGDVYKISRGQFANFSLWYRRQSNQILVHEKIKNNDYDVWIELSADERIPLQVLEDWVTEFPSCSGGDDILEFQKIVVLSDGKAFAELGVTDDEYKEEGKVPIDCKAEFQRLCQKYPKKVPQMLYVCPHSLLCFGFTYDTDNYYIYDSDIGVPDVRCKGKCAITNPRALRIFKQNFIFDEEIITRIRRRPRLEMIRKYIPRFLRDRVFRVIENDTNRMKDLMARNWWDYYVAPLPRKIWNFIKMIAPLLAAGLAIWGMSKVAGRVWDFIRGLFGLEDAQGLHNSGASPSRRPRPKAQRNTRVYSTQAEKSENLENKIEKICRNYVCLQIGTSFVTAFGLRGSQLLLPRHLARKIKDQPEIKLVWYCRSANGLNIKTSNVKLRDIPNRDLTIVEFDRTAPLFGDCTGYFRSRKDPFQEEFHEGILVACACLDLTVKEIDVRLTTKVPSVTSTAPDGTTFTSSDCVEYNYQARGLCGSLLVVNSIRPIYAMHVAGSPGMDTGIGVCLFREDFEFESQGLEYEDYEDTGEDTAYYGDDCNIVYIASVDKDLVPHIPSKTNIIPSLINDCFEDEPATQPAILTPSDPRYTHPFSPLYYGVRKNGFPTRDFQIPFLNEAFDIVRELIVGGKMIRPPAVLTLKEAIVGLPDIEVDDKFLERNMEGELENPYFSAIPLDTSSGFPYSSVRYRKLYGISGTDKQGWLEYTRDKGNRPVDVSIHEKLMMDLERNAQARRKGVVTNNIFQDCLKDERRPIKKVLAQGGTRLFSMSNVEGTISLRRFTLDLTSHIRYNRITNGIGVGMNVDSPEWTILAQKLLAFEGLGNECVFTTDFTNFGAGLNLGVATYFGDLIKCFYEYNEVPLTKSQLTEVDVLIMELLGSSHIVGNLIYRTYAGSPSGAAITVEMNSFVHLMYIVVAYNIIGRVIFDIRHGGKSSLRTEYVELVKYLEDLDKLVDMPLSTFRDNVFCCTYGDDGIFSVTRLFAEQFNAVTINLVLKVHRIGVTDASKSELITKYTSIYEATFLKRSFKHHELFPTVMWMAAIDWQTVRECVRWVHRKP